MSGNFTSQAPTGFLSTLPQGERPDTRPPAPSISRFLSTLPQGERRELLDMQPGNIIFLSTLPQGERRIMDTVGESELLFLSTLPQGERLGPLIPFSRSITISIHAPARGATVPWQNPSGIRTISIHAPARGATFDKNYAHSATIFLSTLPQGERLNLPARKQCGQAISIHAPARGATRSYVGVLFLHFDFYPRSRKGSDLDSRWKKAS